MQQVQYQLTVQSDKTLTVAVANNSHTHTSANITDLSTALSGYALRSGASFVGASGVIKVGYNDYIQLGGIAGSGGAGSGIGEAYIKYGSSIVSGSPRLLTIGLTPTAMLVLHQLV